MKASTRANLRRIRDLAKAAQRFSRADLQKVWGAVSELDGAELVVLAERAAGYDVGGMSRQEILDMVWSFIERSPEEIIEMIEEVADSTYDQTPAGKKNGATATVEESAAEDTDDDYDSFAYDPDADEDDGDAESVGAASEPDGDTEDCGHENIHTGGTAAPSPAPRYVTPQEGAVGVDYPTLETTIDLDEIEAPAIRSTEPREMTAHRERKWRYADYARLRTRIEARELTDDEYEALVEEAAAEGGWKVRDLLLAGARSGYEVEELADRWLPSRYDRDWVKAAAR